MPNYDDIKNLASYFSAKRDPWDHHETSVAFLVSRTAMLLDFSGEELEMIVIGAHLHDIGKLLVRSDLLKVTRQYDHVERLEMQMHSVLGWELCTELGYHPIIADIVRHTHEHWDGSGYPDGLKELDIFIGARISAVCDGWSALTNKRSYREAYSPLMAREIMRSERGTKFDPQLLDLFFEKVIDE